MKRSGTKHSAPRPPRSVAARSYLETLALTALLAAVITVPLQAQGRPPGPPQVACKGVFGVGALEVAKYDDGGDPAVVVGEFDFFIARPLELVEYLDTDPSRLVALKAELTLIAFPGSDVQLPADSSYAPCSTSWKVSNPPPGRVEDLGTIESFCEAVLIGDPAEGPNAFEMFIREEVANTGIDSREVGDPWPDGTFNCGRMHTNGVWHADTDTADVTVAGKLCVCD